MPDCILCNIQMQSVRMLFLPVESSRGSYERITVKVKMPDSSEHRRNFHGQDTLQASCTRYVYFMYRYVQLLQVWRM